jgi:hypothetical protein
LVLFFKKEPLALPLACRAGDLRTWAVTKERTKNVASLGSLYAEGPQPKQSVAPSPVFSWVIS